MRSQSRSDVTSVVVTDGAANALTLSVQQYENDAGLLSKITGPYLLSISGTAADVSTALDALNSDTHVSSITLTDGAPLALSVQQVGRYNRLWARSQAPTRLPLPTARRMSRRTSTH